MHLTTSFEIARDVDEVLQALVDVERVAPCIPGVAVKQRSADGAIEGSFAAKVGPIKVAYDAAITATQVEREAARAAFRVRGIERSDGGAADALVAVTVVPTEGGARVEVETDLSVRGKVAQYGRGTIGPLAAGLTEQFATNLQAMFDDGYRPTVPSGDAALVAHGVSEPLLEPVRSLRAKRWWRYAALAGVAVGAVAVAAAAFGRRGSN